jgi:capsular polysaccharide transport system permease protein
MINRGLIRKNLWFIIIVILPVVVSATYYGGVAADIYVSESRFVVKSHADRPTQQTTLASLIQTSGLSSGQEQTNEVLDYIRSRNALADMQRRVGIKAIYTSPDADRLSRYPALFHDDRFENLYRYYLSMIDTRTDSETGLAVLSVKAFSPGDSRKINALLLDLSEDLVNRLNDKARKNAIAEAQARVDEAETRMRSARVSLAKYRNDKNLIDPGKQESGVLDVSNKLVSEQAALQAQLDLMMRVAPENPAIPSIRSRITAIGRVIDIQNGRAVGTNSAISSKLAGYESLALEQEFASQMLTASDASLEQARAEAQRQQFYLERVVEPNTPDLATLPHRWRQVLTIAAAALCLYFIGWMLIVGILQHSPED